MSAYNPSFDIGKRIFATDLEYGERGETLVRAFLEALSYGEFEVKTDRYRNGRVVIETQQNPRNTGWKPSGLNVTSAKWWIYVFALSEMTDSDSGAFIAIEVNRLKRYLRANSALFNEDTKKTFAPNTDNPSKGWLLFPEHVSDLLTNAEYDG